MKSCRPLFYPLLGPCLFSAHTHAACVATTHENNTCELVTLRLVLFFCWRWLCGRINVNRALPTGYVLERWWVNDLQWFWSADFKSVGEFEKPSGSIPPFTRWVFFLGGSLVFRFFVFSLTFVPLLDIWAHLARKCQVHPFFSCLVFFSFLVFFFRPVLAAGKYAPSRASFCASHECMSLFVHKWRVDAPLRGCTEGVAGGLIHMWMVCTVLVFYWFGISKVESASAASAASLDFINFQK